MSNIYLNPQDVPSTKLAELFVTIDGNRYSVLFAKDFEAKASIETSDVPILGKLIKGKKATGLEVSISMTLYKCSEIFDNIVEKFKNTGLLPAFEIQTSSSDPATSIGRSTKVYKDCVLDGDVLLSMFDADGEFIEQSIECFAMDYSSAEKYKNPSYM